MRARLPARAVRITLAAAFVALGAPAAAQPAPPPAFASLLQEMVTKDGAPGVAALVFRDGRLLYRAQAGTIDPDAPLPVASASKWVAVALVMTLVDEGRLSLDAPVGRYLPEINGPAASITLRQLLSFTSGQGGLAALADLRQPPDISLEESARRIAARPLVNPPGAAFQYGSGALQIAGALAERATAKRWAELFAERLGAPLDMQRSQWTHPFYARRDPSAVSNPNLQGGLVTTAEDYAHFLSMVAAGGVFRGQRVLSPAAAEEMERLQTAGARLEIAASRKDWKVAGYALGNWCEQAEPSGRCTLVSSPGALGTYPWIDRATGTYGIFVMHHRFPRVSASLVKARAVAVAAATAAATAKVEDRPSASAYAPGWSAVHADAANSDYFPWPGPTDLTLAWSRTFDGMINLGPTSDGMGRLYVTTGGKGCRLHALDRATGRTIWCSSALAKLAVASSPLIDRHGTLYLGDGQAMRAFDRIGTLRWSRAITGVPLSAQFTPAGDLLFITHVGIVYVLNRDTGRPVVDPLPLVPGAAVDPAQGALACMRGLPACPSANTPAMDLATGRFFFTFWTPGAKRAGVRAMRITSGPAPRLVAEWINDGLPAGSAASPDLSADGKRLYVTDNQGSLHALDAATGRVLWSLPIGFAAAGSVSTSPEGLIMPAGGRGAALMAIADHGDRGIVRWRHDELENFGVATQAAGFLAYPTVATGRGTADLLVVDTRTGKVLDREPIPGKPFFTVGTTIDRDASVYVPTIGGALHAFAPGRADRAQ